MWILLSINRDLQHVHIQTAGWTPASTPGPGAGLCSAIELQWHSSLLPVKVWLGSAWAPSAGLCTKRKRQVWRMNQLCQLGMFKSGIPGTLALLRARTVASVALSGLIQPARDSTEFKFWRWFNIYIAYKQLQAPSRQRRMVY
jgi:hypothetical protein